MTIETLIKVVPPPAAPSEAFSGPWEVVEAELGTALPRDYKEYARLYGCGDFLGFLGVYIPRCRNRYVRLESAARATRDMFVQDEDLPYPLWPSPGGLLSFGRTDNGDCLFWLTQGAPEDWRVVVWGRGLQACETFDCDLTDFLARLASGEILPDDFPDDLLPYNPLFEPYDPPPAAAMVNLSWRLGGYGLGPSGVSTLRLRDED